MRFRENSTENSTMDNTTRIIFSDAQLTISKTDSLVNQDIEKHLLLDLAIVGAVFLVIPVNLCVLYWIKNKARTLVDGMIFLGKLPALIKSYL